MLLSCFYLITFELVIYLLSLNPILTSLSSCVFHSINVLLWLSLCFYFLRHTLKIYFYINLFFSIFFTSSLQNTIKPKMLRYTNKNTQFIYFIFQTASTSCRSLPTLSITTCLHYSDPHSIWWQCFCFFDRRLRSHDIPNHYLLNNTSLTILFFLIFLSQSHEWEKLPNCLNLGNNFFLKAYWCLQLFKVSLFIYLSKFNIIY